MAYSRITVALGFLKRVELTRLDAYRIADEIGEFRPTDRSVIDMREEERALDNFDRAHGFYRTRGPQD